MQRGERHTVVYDRHFFPVVNEGRHDFQSILESQCLVVDLHEAYLVLICVVINLFQALQNTITLFAFVRNLRVCYSGCVVISLFVVRIVKDW